jgi:hypothetical protein
MYPVNPNMLLQMIRSGKNPEQLMLSILQGQAYNNPLGKNLLNLAQTGRTDELEKVVRNIYTQQGGKNFDQDFEAFKKNMGL